MYLIVIGSLYTTVAGLRVGLDEIEICGCQLNMIKRKVVHDCKYCKFLWGVFLILSEIKMA